MPDPDLEDDTLARQGMIEIYGNRVLLDGTNLKRDERPTRAGQFTAKADL